MNVVGRLRVLNCSYIKSHNVTRKTPSYSPHKIRYCLNFHEANSARIWLKFHPLVAASSILIFGTEAISRKGFPRGRVVAPKGEAPICYSTKFPENVRNVGRDGGTGGGVQNLSM